MIKFLSLFFLVISFSSNVSYAEVVLSESSQQIRNMQNPAISQFSSGQPSKDQIRSLAQDGIDTIINLRPKEEMNWDEAAFVTSLDINYVELPIAGKADISFANALKLKALLASRQGEALVHCASGNRVGALMALAHYHETKDMSASLSYGEQWGLRGLLPVVQEKLEAAQGANTPQ